MNINDSLVEVIAKCITKWMDTKTVDQIKYDSKYTKHHQIAATNRMETPVHGGNLKRMADTPTIVQRQ